MGGTDHRERRVGRLINWSQHYRKAARLRSSRLTFHHYKNAVKRTQAGMQEAIANSTL